MQLDMLVLFIESTADQPTLNIAWPLIGQHKLTAHMYRDWSTVKTYSSTTVQRTVCAPAVCVGSINLYSNVQLCSQKLEVQSIYTSCVQ